MTATQTGVNKTGEFNFELLFAGDFPRVTAEVTLAAGTAYKAGSVLGKATTGGKCALVDSSKSDGTQNVYAVLAEEVDATTADRTGVAYLTGEFAMERAVFGGADTVETHRDSARALSIFFHSVLLQPNQ